MSQEERYIYWKSDSPIFNSITNTTPLRTDNCWKQGWKRKI